MEDESGHGTLPITTQSPRASAAGLTPLLKLGGKVTARCPKFKQRYPSGGLLGLQARALSNAQDEQRHEADATEQRRESHRIVFEPMPIRKHDTISCYRHFFLVRAPAACFTAWGSPGDRIGVSGGWAMRPAQVGIQLSWGSVVPALNRRAPAIGRGAKFG